MVVRDARMRAGFSQTALAERAGVTQSVVSAYELGRRQPSLPMLAGLVAAAGYELELRLAEPADRLTGPVGIRVRERRAAIHTLAARQGITVIGVFGSVARGEDQPGSDVDLLVRLPPDASLFTMRRLAAALEDLLDARVDLVPSDGLKKDVRARVDADLVRL